MSEASSVVASSAVAMSLPICSSSLKSMMTMRGRIISFPMMMNAAFTGLHGEGICQSHAFSQMTGNR